MYPRLVTKRTSINLDVDLVGQAKAVLGTSEVTETIHMALAEIVRMQRLRRLASRDFPDLTPAALAQLRQPRAAKH
jgi:Arc/MetJ family transcription regulator